MTDYTELVNALRYCSTTEWMVYCNVNCKYGWEERSKGCKDLLMTDAAAAIEGLEAEIAELKRVNMEIFEDLPKRGKWNNRDAEERCSVCGAEATSFYDGCDGIVWAKYPLPNYCPNCGAKMEVQDGKD